MWEDLQQFIDALSPTIRGAVNEALQKVRNSADLNAIELAWANGDVDRVVSLLLGGAANDTTMWDPVHAAVTQAIEEAATDTVMLQMKGYGDMMKVVMGASTDPIVTQSVSADLVREVDSTTRDAISQWVQRAVASGKNPVNAITEIVGRMQADGSRVGGVLGLTQSQMSSVDSYRAALMGGPNTAVYQDALDRALRDARFDASVKSAMASGNKLSQSQIDNMVRRYESRFLAYRADTIGITEAGRAMAKGQKYAWDASISAGHIAAGELQKRWVTAGDDRVRPFHAELQNVIVPYNKPFMLKTGGKKTFMVRPVWGAPQEPRCRCVTMIRPRLDA